MTSCFCDRVETKYFHNVKATLWTGACQYGCAALFASAAKQQRCILFSHVQMRRMISIDFGSNRLIVQYFCFSLYVRHYTVWECFCLTHHSAAPSSLRFFTLHPLLSVSEFTFVAEVWPLQHRHALLQGGLIQTFQPKCFNSHEGKKKRGRKSKEAKAKQA